MKRKLGIMRVGVLIIVLIFSYVSTWNILIHYGPIKTDTFRYGSRGVIVTEVQRRLKAWGYYKGNLDGIYGYETYLGVKSFQRKNGLTVDGVAGDRTLSALGINTGSSSKSSSNVASSNNSDVMLLARLINGEARGEPYEGQVAVGSVVLNRVKHPKFPNTIAGVIYQPGAYTAIVDGQIHAQMEDSSIRAARDAINGWDPSGGAIYYFNPNTATSGWIWSRPLIKIIGSHRFCR